MPYQHKQDRATFFGPHLVGFQPRIMLEDILTELERARRKFPEQSVWKTLAALTEEVGELNQAILQDSDEKTKGVTAEQIYKEAVQVAVMAIRVALDCEYAVGE